MVWYGTVIALFWGASKAAFWQVKLTVLSSGSSHFSQDKHSPSRRWSLFSSIYMSKISELLQMKKRKYFLSLLLLLAHLQAISNDVETQYKSKWTWNVVLISFQLRCNIPSFCCTYVKRCPYTCTCDFNNLMWGLSFRVVRTCVRGPMEPFCFGWPIKSCCGWPFVAMLWPGTCSP